MYKLQFFTFISDNISKVRMMSHVGAGSSEQCLVGALTTSLLISSTVTSSKADNLSQGRSSILGDGALAVSTRILSTFDRKKSAKVAAECAESEDCCVVLSKTSNLDHRAFES